MLIWPRRSSLFIIRGSWPVDWKKLSFQSQTLRLLSAFSMVLPWWWMDFFLVQILLIYLFLSQRSFSLLQRLRRSRGKNQMQVFSMIYLFLCFSTEMFFYLFFLKFTFVLFIDLLWYWPSFCFSSSLLPMFVNLSYYLGSRYSLRKSPSSIIQSWLNETAESMREGFSQLFQKYLMSSQFLMSSKQGCLRHSRAVSLWSGDMASMPLRRESALWESFPTQRFSRVQMCMTSGNLIPTKGGCLRKYQQSQGLSFPRHFWIKKSWLISFSPGNSGIPSLSSPITHPTAQMSICRPYGAPTSSSGGRYHRVATYQVNGQPAYLRIDRAKPKSQIFTTRQGFPPTRMFQGLMSRWMTSLECMKASPWSIWQTTERTMSGGSPFCAISRIQRRLLSTNQKTKHTRPFLFLKTYLNYTMFLCRKVLCIFIYLFVVFNTSSSSHDSLNCFIATIFPLYFCLHLWTVPYAPQPITFSISYFCINLMETQTGSQFFKGQGSKDQIWKLNDRRAQKNGPHANIYWVKKQLKNQDGSEKASKWIGSHKYVGDWLNNKKQGFGIQHYANGDKYEGGWKNNLRHGQGTLWVSEGKNRLRREYTGDWQENKKKGKGTMFFKNGDRYDGQWDNDQPHGQGRMIKSNGDVYEGMWYMGKKSGYGVLTKRCGDHFEGHWVQDKREGQGSYFFSKSNKVFVGEWVDDTPKTGIYSEVQDPYNLDISQPKHFDDEYRLPKLPAIMLCDPTEVLQGSMEEVRKQRTIYRAKFIPLDQLYKINQFEQLKSQFQSACVRDETTISLTSLHAKLLSMRFNISEGDLEARLKVLSENFNREQISFELFARVLAIMIEVGGFEEEGDRVEEEYLGSEESQIQD